MIRLRLGACLVAASLAVSAAPASASNFTSCVWRHTEVDVTQHLVALIAALKQQLENRPRSDPYYGLIAGKHAGAQILLAKLNFGHIGGFHVARFMCGVDVSPS